MSKKEEETEVNIKESSEYLLNVDRLKGEIILIVFKANKYFIYRDFESKH